MRTQPTKYKTSYASLHLAKTEEATDDSYWMCKTGTYISKDSIPVEVYMCENISNGKHDYYTQLTLKHKGYQYSVTYDEVYSDRGVQLICSRLIREIVK
jgi:hypothetical protein